MDTYRATNTTNGKFYIGSTNNFEKRKKEHLASKDSYPFQNALRKKPDAFEWECWTDDCDEPVLEQALLDMWFGTEQCYNLNPSAKHPPRPEKDTLVKNGKRVSEYLRDSGYYGSDKHRERSRQSGVKSAVTNMTNGSGIFGEYQGSQRHKEVGHQSGQKAVSNKTGIHSEGYKNSDTCRETRKQNGKKLHQEKRGLFNEDVRKNLELSLSKPVLLHYPDGRVEKYQSASDASRKTGFNQSTLSRLANSGKEGKRGACKGISVFYEDRAAGKTI